MSKAFVLGNGSMMIGLGRDGLVYDLYYPYVGLENHTAGGNVHRVGAVSYTHLDVYKRQR